MFPFWRDPVACLTKTFQRPPAGIIEHSPARIARSRSLGDTIWCRAGMIVIDGTGIATVLVVEGTGSRAMMTGGKAETVSADTKDICILEQ